MDEQFITASVQGTRLFASSALPVPWWSYSKTVLAAAALVLVARGSLHLDEPFRATPFTLRHLLQHRSGLPDYGSLAAYHAAVASGEVPWTVDDMLARAGAAAVVAKPGEKFAYSNIGYLLVRQSIEQACGDPLSTALQALVLRPLGIEAVRLACLPDDLDGTAWGNAARYHPGWVYHGLLVGSAAAAALLLQRLLDGGLLPGTLLRAMCTPEPVMGAVRGRPWSSVGYGLGMGFGMTKAGVFAGHTGAGPGSVSAIYRQMQGPEQSRVTAAVFAPLESPGHAESKAVALACGR